MFAMPRFSFIFGIDFRVLGARYNKEEDKWYFESHLFEYDQNAYEASVKGTSLEGKAPLLDWDHERDAEAIKTFQTNGGLWNFMKISKITVTHSRAWTEILEKNSMEGEEVQHNLEDGVQLLLGPSSPGKNQIVLAHTVLNSAYGHFTNLVTSNDSNEYVSPIQIVDGVTVAKRLDLIFEKFRSDSASSAQSAGGVKSSELNKKKGNGSKTSGRLKKKRKGHPESDDDLFPDDKVDNVMNGRDISNAKDGSRLDGDVDSSMEGGNSMHQCVEYVTYSLLSSPTVTRLPVATLFAVHIPGVKAMSMSA
jgi:hypothetical protein